MSQFSLTQRKKSTVAGSLVVLCILGLFTVLSLLLIVLGAQAYTAINDQQVETDQIRSSLNYVANKIRFANGEVNVEPLGNGNALVIENKLEDATYNTYIYFDGENLREVAVEPGMQPQSGEGDKIINVTDFKIEQQKNMLCLTAMAKKDVLVELKIGLGLVNNGH